MALVSKITKKIDVPHEPGEWFEIKKLSWRQLEKAENINLEKTLKQFKDVDPGLMQGFAQGDDQEKKAKAGTDYDRATILQKGIKAWSYDAEVNAENIDDLDEQTAEWAMNEIMEFTKPRSEDERKNGS